MPIVRALEAATRLFSGSSLLHATLRGPEFASEKRPDTTRIVTLGDSWTVGVNVAFEEAYPAVLERALRDRVPGRRFEVLNHGTIGAGVTTGKHALATALELNPDVVVLAYAQNDERRTQTQRMLGPLVFEPRGLLRRLAAGSELVRLWSYYWRPDGKRPSAMIRHEMPFSPDLRPCPPDEPESSPYAQALAGLVTTARDAGADVILLYAQVPEFPSHCTRLAMDAVSRAHSVSLVDGAQVLAMAEQNQVRDLERQHDLANAGSAAEGFAGSVSGVVFRVDAGSASGPIYLMGHGAELADFAPNVLVMTDDGTNGDEVSGDGVWTLAVSFSERRSGRYSYTNGHGAGVWVGLESRRARAFEAPPLGAAVYRPIDVFGYHWLRSDPSHPDAAGHERIAVALVEPVLGAVSVAVDTSAGPGSASMACPTTRRGGGDFGRGAPSSTSW